MHRRAGQLRSQSTSSSLVLGNWYDLELVSRDRSDGVLRSNFILLGLLHRPPPMMLAFTSSKGVGTYISGSSVDRDGPFGVKVEARKPSQRR